MALTSLLAVALLLFASAPTLARSGTADQPGLKAAAAWITASPSGTGDTTAFVVVDNPTMYDVYIIGAESEVAASIEFRDASKGAPAEAVKEVAVPAFGQLEMSASSVYLVLKGLKKPLSAGSEAEIVLLADGGDRLTVVAKAK